MLAIADGAGVLVTVMAMVMAIMTPGITIHGHITAGVTHLHGMDGTGHTITKGITDTTTVTIMATGMVITVDVTIITTPIILHILMEGEGV